MLFTVYAIVLRAFMFSDSKMMADVLSREEGRMSCVVRLGKSQRDRSRRQMFQPLTMLEITLERKSAGQAPTVKEVRIAAPRVSIPFDPYKTAIAMFMAEFTGNVTRAEESSPALFDFIADSVQWLDAARDGFANFHLIYMTRLTRFIGFFPNDENYTDGSCFDMTNGCFVELPTPRRGFLDKRESKVMHILIRMDYGSMQRLHLSQTGRNRCLDVILDYYSLHIPNIKDVKSLKVLRELFSAT